MAVAAIKPIIGKTRLLVTHEGSKELLTMIYPYDRINEVRIDFDEKCIKILFGNSDSYEVVYESSVKEQLNNFHRALITAMSGITQEEIIRARELADKRRKEAENNLKTAKDKKK